jgi:hypothetical protein
MKMSPLPTIHEDVPFLDDDFYLLESKPTNSFGICEKIAFWTIFIIIVMLILTAFQIIGPPPQAVFSMICIMIVMIIMLVIYVPDDANTYHDALV